MSDKHGCERVRPGTYVIEMDGRGKTEHVRDRDGWEGKREYGRTRPR